MPYTVPELAGDVAKWARETGDQLHGVIEGELPLDEPVTEDVKLTLRSLRLALAQYADGMDRVAAGETATVIRFPSRDELEFSTI